VLKAVPSRDGIERSALEKGLCVGKEINRCLKPGLLIGDSSNALAGLASAILTGIGQQGRRAFRLLQRPA
jgi:hypothetical protein